MNEVSLPFLCFSPIARIFRVGVAVPSDFGGRVLAIKVFVVRTLGSRERGTVGM